MTDGRKSGGFAICEADEACVPLDAGKKLSEEWGEKVVVLLYV